MSIIRVSKRENPFVMIDKTMLSDNRLSWKAKGILTYLLSKPNDWEVRVTDIIKQSKDGRDAVYSGIKELEQYGYIKREQIRDNGTFKGLRYVVFETPQESDETETTGPKTVDIEPFSPHTENPDTVKPDTEKAELTNNDLTNNDLNMDGWMGVQSSEINTTDKNNSELSHAKEKWDKFRGLCQKQGLDEQTTLDLWKVYQHHYRHVPITAAMAVLRDLLYEKWDNESKAFFGLDSVKFRNFIGLFHHRMKTANELAVAIEDIKGDVRS